MPKVSTSTLSIASTNSKATASVSYNSSTRVKTTSITVAYSGSVLTFPTVTEYMTWLTEVVLPLTNSIHSVSEAGTGYAAATPGTAGDDSIGD